MEEELAGRWKELKLSEEEEIPADITIQEEEGSTSKENFSLIGALISVRPFNYVALGRTMEKVWRPRKGMEFRKLGDNCMQFVFFLKKDYDRVLIGRPWSFDKFLLVVQEYNPETRPSEIGFEHSPFWIRVLDLPRATMIAKIGEMIGNAIGECMEVDFVEKGRAKGLNMRIQVLINIKNL